jgi:hypothetical protein
MNWIVAYDWSGCPQETETQWQPRGPRVRELPSELQSPSYRFASYLFSFTAPVTPSTLTSVIVASVMTHFTKQSALAASPLPAEEPIPIAFFGAGS